MKQTKTPQGDSAQTFNSKLLVRRISPAILGLACLAGCSEDGETIILPAPTPPGQTSNVLPVASLSADPSTGIAPLEVTFSGEASTDPDGTIMGYAWDFDGDDRVDAMGETVSFSYETPGTYTATLMVMDNDGAMTSDTIDIIVSEPLQIGECDGSLNGQTRRLGTNLYETFEDGSNVFFNDLFREAQFFVPVDRDDLSNFGNPDVTLELDANGYPTNIGEVQIGDSGNMVTVAAQSVIYDGRNYLPGEYTLAWQGEGVFTLDAGGTRVEIEDVDEPGRNTEEDNVRSVMIPAGLEELGILLTILESDEDNPLTNFRLWVPGTAPADPGQDFEWPVENLFTEQTLRNVEPFSLIRFMDWNRTNFAPHPEDFDQRSVASRFSWSGTDENAFGTGVPYEAMIQLANETCSDMWITVPHMVNADYHTQLAMLINGEIDPRISLDPTLKVYIEFSNEAWNGLFPVRQALIDEAEEIIETGDIGPIDPSDFGPERVYARRSAELFRTFNDVLGEERTVTVLSGQAGFARVLEEATNELELQGDLELVDVLAIAPYLPSGEEISLAVTEVARILGDDPESASPLSDAQIASVMDLHIEDVDENFRIGALEDGGQENFLNRDLAMTLGLPLITYEGGQHLIGDDGENVMFFADIPRINASPGMGEVIAAYLPAWFEFSEDVNSNADPDLTTLTLYHASGFWNRNEAFGLLEFDRQDPDDSPKYSAVLDFLDAEE